MYVTTKEYFGNTDISTLSKEQLENAFNLLTRINLLRRIVGEPFLITSGYRTPEHNAKIGGAARSNHLLCAAIDIADANGELKKFMMKDDNYWLKEFGLYMEHPKDTPTWMHLQCVPPKSGNRVFGR